jgi:hypothetical protein
MVVNWIDARATIVCDWDDSRMIIACEIGAEAKKRKNREQQLHTAFARNLATSPPAASRATSTVARTPGDGLFLWYWALSPLVYFLKGK